MAKLGVVGVEVWWDECEVVFLGEGMWMVRGGATCV